MGVAVITLDNLRQRVGNVDRFFDDDGDGLPDTDIVAAICEQASDAARSLLYPRDLDDFVFQDTSVVGLIADVALGLAGSRRPEHMMSNGAFPYAERAKEAKAELRRIGEGFQRSFAEPERSKKTRGATQVDVPASHVFAVSRTRQGGSGTF
jgi:hypothetical protein